MTDSQAEADAMMGVLGKYGLDREPTPTEVADLILSLLSQDELSSRSGDLARLIWGLAKTDNAEAKLSVVRRLDSLSDRAVCTEIGKLAVSLEDDIPVNYLRQVLSQSQSENAKIAAVYALGNSTVHGEEIFGLLLTLAEDEALSENLRGFAIEGLATLGASEALPNLRELAFRKDIPPKVAFWIAYSLGEIGDETAILALEFLSKDSRQGEFGKTIGEEARESLDIVNAKG